MASRKRHCCPLDDCVIHRRHSLARVNSTALLLITPRACLKLEIVYFCMAMCMLDILLLYLFDGRLDPCYDTRFVHVNYPRIAKHNLCPTNHFFFARPLYHRGALHGRQRTTPFSTASACAIGSLAPKCPPISCNAMRGQYSRVRIGIIRKTYSMRAEGFAL